MPKSRNACFTFEPKNLAVSCAMCNISKHTTQILVNSTSVNYPSYKSGFLIVHPHFDQYDDYIEHFMRVIYIEKKRTDGSNKGKKTIEICELNREQLICQNAELNYTAGSFTELMIKIVRTTNNAQILEPFIFIFNKLSELNFIKEQDISDETIKIALGRVL